MNKEKRPSKKNSMKENKKHPYKRKREIRIRCVILIFFIGFFMGIYVNSVYHKTIELYDGCWVRTQAGDEWICVNIKDMTPQRALEVCKHEVGHEMFAETCEKDIDLCFDVVEILNKTGIE